MKAFLCHSSKNADFVVDVARFLKRNMDVFYYERYQDPTDPFWETIKNEIAASDVFITFVGEELTENQRKEFKHAYIDHAVQRRTKHKHSLVFVLLDDAKFPDHLKEDVANDDDRSPPLEQYAQRRVETGGAAKAMEAARTIIVEALKQPFCWDGLPSNPHLFSYEKHIIDHFVDKERLRPHLKGNDDCDSAPRGGKGGGRAPEISEADARRLEEISKSELGGCPASWPAVKRMEEGESRTIQQVYKRIAKERGVTVSDEEIDKKTEEWQSKVGGSRDENAKVVVAALTNYHRPKKDAETSWCCLVDRNADMCFPEAGPREFMYFPREKRRRLKAAILVSGGIAPGTNAVIDGIVQRHLQHAEEFGYLSGLAIVGIKNGFRAFDNWGDNNSRLDLKEMHMNTSYRASEGGSLLGTSRVDELLIEEDDRWSKLNSIADKLYHSQVDILYIIGGDGSMRAAHALWNIAQEPTEGRKNKLHKLSVVAIPKTMDNDILWVWQTFGFLSAVEKAREIIDHLATEVGSNPRLCVVQLFGSDSGFVVSHAVLASRPAQCDVALIPEVKFSIEALERHLRAKMDVRLDSELMRRGLVVMAETAIPEDASKFVDAERVYEETGKDSQFRVGLTKEEIDAIEEFLARRGKGERKPGQTSDELRSAGLRIVSLGLRNLLNKGDDGDGPEQELRVVKNEPRHLLRALPPSCTDIIMGNRLGTLAVDNALAGYTDFMVSQWLTEYVLVPLELVVLGRKRIPETGIFWKSVIGKTGQPAKLS